MIHINKTLKVLSLLIIALSFSFCAGNNDKEQRQKKIKELEKSTYTSKQAISQTTADSLVNLYDSYVKDFPKDSLCSEYLFKAADVCSNTKQCQKALSYLDMIINSYPNSKFVEISYFQKGVVWQESCKNKQEAAKAFNLFIQKYPKSQHVIDAKAMIQLDTMKDDMQLIREFEKKNKENN